VPVSEYQYYEFRAVDRPLDERQMAELRALSTRAVITPTSFVNSYQWGNFRGDPVAMVQGYFDAFLYLANWGSRQVMLRLPARLLDVTTAQRYCAGNTAATAWAHGEHVILAFTSENEDGDEDWVEGDEDSLASIVPARSELAAGDLRLLYLGWLLTVQADELADDEPEPPVPPGLRELTAPLRSFTDFLRLDQDLLAAAAIASEPARAAAVSEEELAERIEHLPAAEKDAILLRLFKGDDPHLRTELLRRFCQDGPDFQEGPATRTAGQLLDSARRLRAERERVADRRRAAERAQRERAAAAAREQRLATLADNPEQAWQRVGALIETKKPREYDTAVELLVDLRALSERDGQPATFTQRFGLLCQRHQRKPSLLERFDRAGLLAAPGP
jgi:hypothetical protein